MTDLQLTYLGNLAILMLPLVGYAIYKAYKEIME